MSEANGLALHLQGVGTPTAGVARWQEIDVLLAVEREIFAAAVSDRQASCRVRLADDARRWRDSSAECQKESRLSGQVTEAAKEVERARQATLDTHAAVLLAVDEGDPKELDRAERQSAEAMGKLAQAEERERLTRLQLAVAQTKAAEEAVAAIDRLAGDAAAVVQGRLDQARAALLDAVRPHLAALLLDEVELVELQTFWQRQSPVSKSNRGRQLAGLA